MKLQDFLAPSTAPVPFTVEGIDEQLHCKVLTCEEVAAISIDANEAKTAGSGYRFASRLLALCLVDADGKALTTEDAWRNITVRQQKGITKLVDKIREINGMLDEAEVKDLGNVSTETSASDSSSSSASDSEKLEASSAA